MNYWDDIPAKRDWSTRKFLRQDYNKIITNYHNAVAKYKCENQDCIEVIKNYQGMNTLFYSDSPYQGTKDYDKKWKSYRDIYC